MSCKPQPEIILENHYGSHQSAVFCERYGEELAEQGFAREVDLIIRSDHQTNILYDEGHLIGDPNLSEKASCAWMNILEGFIPEEGYHLGYMPDDQALWMLPDGWEEEEEL